MEDYYNMLLYSTILNINDSLSIEAFIRLVIECNQTNPFAENIIPEMNWNGERNIRFGSDGLWLEIEEDENKNIIAVRYEKKAADGAVWDTDYIMNFDEMKIAIQLDCSYTEDALMENPMFSSPLFLSGLIEGGFLKADNGLPILEKPIVITEENMAILVDVINGTGHYHLPVVYVSKTFNDADPVDAGRLSRKLKGIAHVLLEDDKRLNSDLREACDDQNEYYGGIGIYFPNQRRRRFIYRNNADADGLLMDKVVNAVFQYAAAQTIPIAYTWMGVSNSLLNDRFNRQTEERLAAERARQDAEDEVEEFLDTFDDDHQKLQQQINELTRANASLQQENQGIRAKLYDSENIPLIYYGDEEEFYQDEIKEILLDVLADALKNTDDKTRRSDVLKDVLNSNNFQKLSSRRRDEIKGLLKDYKTMPSTLRQKLQKFGFEITEEGKHYRLTYYGDNRYKTTLAKTGSDCHGGRNSAAAIIKDML